MVSFNVRAASGTVGLVFAARGLECRSFTSSSAVNVEQWKDSPDRGYSIPWTVDVNYHKCAYMDSIVHEFNALKKRWGFPERRAATFILFLIRSVCTLQRHCL
jgi:hypothetical protein